MPTKMLGFLNPENKFHRILRRGIVIAVLTFGAVIIQQIIPMLPEIYIPILAGALALLEKMIREYDWLK